MVCSLIAVGRIFLELNWCGVWNNFASVSMHNPFYCFANDPLRPQNAMFATKVGYEVVRGNGFINPLIISTSNPRKFFFFSRHGTRLPFLNDVHRMNDIHETLKASVIENYEAGRTQLCHLDIENIRNWNINPNITENIHSELVEAGWNELKGLGVRFQAAFPSILPSTYNQTLFFFRPTNTQRTEGSLRGFAEGIFGESENVQFEALTDPDLLLRPQDACPLYSDVIDVLPEMIAFEAGPEYAEMLHQVNRKLGFSGANQLNSREVRTVWDFCAFEQAWDRLTSSPWCAAFSIANHEVMSYFEDLGYYYGMGYGGDVPLFANINCHIMQDLLRFLESTDPNDHVARIYSSHTRGLQLFLVTLGVFDGDDAFTRHNFARKAFREWNASILAPFASNFAVVRFDCAGGDNDLLILYNEKPLNIPGCESNGLCKQSIFVNRYRRFLDANCSQMFCSRNV